MQWAAGGDRWAGRQRGHRRRGARLRLCVQGSWAVATPGIRGTGHPPGSYIDHAQCEVNEPTSRAEPRSETSAKRRRGPAPSRTAPVPLQRHPRPAVTVASHYRADQPCQPRGPAGATAKMPSHSRQRAASAGGVEALVRLISSSSDPGVLLRGAEALADVCSGDCDNRAATRKRAVDAGALEALVQLISGSGQEPDVL
jgi:hypothetical protein